MSQQEQLELDSSELVTAETPKGEKLIGALLTVKENDTRLEIRIGNKSVYGAGEIFLPLALNAIKPKGDSWVLVTVKTGKYIGYKGYFRAWDSPAELGALNSH